MKEALKLALEALEKHGDAYLGHSDEYQFAITKVKEALAQPEQEPVAIMREMLEVQGQHGNWNYDSYMHGLYNGMEYMVALAEKREPKFRDAPDEWLAKYEVKRDNFNSTEPLTEATPPQRKPLTDGSLINEGTKKPEQEPVAITITGKLGNIYSFTGDYSLKKGDKVYTTPPQRTWVGLTDDEVTDCYLDSSEKGILLEDAIEAKLKEKNA